MFALPNEPQSIKTILKNSVRLWRQVIWKVFPMSLLCCLIAGTPNFMLPELHPNPPYLIIETFRDYDAYIPLYFIFVLFAYSAVLHRIQFFAQGLDDNMWRDFVFAAKTLPYATLALAITTLAVSFGIVLFIIPGLILMILLVCYIPLIIFDHRGPIEAFTASCNLVDGNWWRTFVIFLIPSVVFALIAIIIQLGFNDVWLMEFPDKNGNIAVAHNILRIFLATFFMPYIGALLWIQLQDLKLRHQLNTTTSTPQQPAVG
ncbi:MAG: hypothetical protein Tsb005_03800 [Gammaproteobacteria bacterium]